MLISAGIASHLSTNVTDPAKRDRIMTQIPNPRKMILTDELATKRATSMISDLSLTALLLMPGGATTSGSPFGIDQKLRNWSVSAVSELSDLRLPSNVRKRPMRMGTLLCLMMHGSVRADTRDVRLAKNHQVILKRQPTLRHCIGAAVKKRSVASARGT